MMTAAPRRSPSGLRPPRDAARLETDRARITVWSLGPHVYASEVEGHLTQPMSQLIIDHASPMYAPGRTLYGFHNWLGMTNYDSACRVELTRWIMQHRAQSVLHIGTASRMVAMGVSVAKLALGDLLHVHGSLEALEHALRAVLPAR